MPTERSERGPGALLSVVVPCFNEEAVIRQTHARLVAVLDQLDLAFELVYVDDGSTDATAAILAGLRRADGRVRLVRLARNFGHQVALTAGLDHAAGDAVVLIDADLQDPPEVIAAMVARWREGYDVAYGQRTARAGESALKLLTAKLFYRLINRLADVPIPLDAGDFRLLDRRVVEALRAMPERDRFVRGLVSWVGFRQIAVPYPRAPRCAGTTKYPYGKLVRLAADAVLSFSLVPLRAGAFLGLPAAAIGLGGLIIALAAWLFAGAAVSGWGFATLIALFLGGVQLLAVGVLGEYVGRVYREVKRRPLYVVRERLGFAKPRRRSTARRRSTPGPASAAP